MGFQGAEQGCASPTGTIHHYSSAANLCFYLCHTGILK